VGVCLWGVGHEDMEVKLHFELLQWLYAGIALLAAINIGRLATAVKDLGWKFNHWIWVWQKKNSTPQ